MSKVDGYEFRGMPQEVIDFKDQVTEILNYGKAQFQTYAAVPTHRGRLGEMVWVYQGNSGWLYTCTEDNAATWKQVQYFDIS